MVTIAFPYVRLHFKGVGLHGDDQQLNNGTPKGLISYS